ncbi:hypothetical protein CEXT_128911 [Caerostris extrusa]|uniref:DUF5641 domain-containing protein n=1 Tax=Caerostris extrusa TaxID=172846 RepID=A0AAV4NUS9_CAEEX|nr:hypothetical protein CEXT_128911 [Caerostris extrusa]
MEKETPGHYIFSVMPVKMLTPLLYFLRSESSGQVYVKFVAAKITHISIKEGERKFCAWSASGAEVTTMFFVLKLGSLNEMMICPFISNPSSVQTLLNGVLDKRILFKKAKATCQELKVGDIVLIELENKKRVMWPMGKIEKIYSSRDGASRVVQVRTSSGCLTRPIQNFTCWRCQLLEILYSP